MVKKGLRPATVLLDACQTRPDCAGGELYNTFFTAFLLDAFFTTGSGLLRALGLTWGFFYNK